MRFPTAALFAALFAQVAISAALSPASAQEPVGDAARGHTLARQVCAECHQVERGQDAPDRPVSFQRMADDPAATELSLRAFLQTPHRGMPNLVLSKEDIGNVIAYIHTLK